MLHSLRVGKAVKTVHSPPTMLYRTIERDGNRAAPPCEGLLHVAVAHWSRHLTKGARCLLLAIEVTRMGMRADAAAGLKTRGAARDGAGVAAGEAHATSRWGWLRHWEFWLALVVGA